MRIMGQIDIKLPKENSPEGLVCVTVTERSSDVVGNVAWYVNRMEFFSGDNAIQLGREYLQRLRVPIEWQWGETGESDIREAVRICPEFFHGMLA